MRRQRMTPAKNYRRAYKYYLRNHLFSSSGKLCPSGTRRYFRNVTFCSTYVELSMNLYRGLGLGAFGCRNSVYFVTTGLNNKATSVSERALVVLHLSVTKAVHRAHHDDLYSNNLCPKLLFMFYINNVSLFPCSRNCEKQGH
jgi:hypothetical protein